MQERELIDEWKQAGRTEFDQKKKFIKSISKKDSKRINQLADETHEQVFSKLDCLDCANCCTSIPPIVSNTDANRMAKHLKMKRSKFDAEYLKIDEDGDMVINVSPCPFLQNDNYCSIYESRPKACRQYPHTDGLSFVKHLKLHKENLRYCPAVFHILDIMEQKYRHS